MPDLQRLPYGETFRLFSAKREYVGVDEYDIAQQGLTSHHYSNVESTFQRWSVPFRYVWPSELDLMARIAGLRPRERWSGWNREPFTSDSTKLVGVWEFPS